MLKTKRFLYNILKDKYDKGCFAVLGSRRIGKTILFKQLSEEYNDTVYVDISTLKNDFDIEEYIKSCLSQGVRRICFDEVCKISEDMYADFISVVKLYSSEMTFFITGSVASVVKDMCLLIGRGECYELPPIMYIERLCWGNGMSTVSADIVTEHTSVDSFIEYLKRQNQLNQKQFIQYIADVVRDTLESYLRNNAIGDCFQEINEDILRRALKYISLCQYVYKTKNNYVSVPALSKKFKNLHDKCIEGYKNKWGLTSDEIAYVVSILYGCNLAKKIYKYRGSNTEIKSIKDTDAMVGSCIFEYPWLTSFFFTEDIQDEEILLDMWVENAIMLRCSYLYNYVDKLRTVANDEIDIVYTIDDEVYGLEVKNRPYTNLSRGYVSRIKDFADSIMLKEFEFTCTDTNDRALRIDKLVVSLELEYINKSRMGYIDCSEPLRSLYEKYFKNQ